MYKETFLRIKFIVFSLFLLSQVESNHQQGNNNNDSRLLVISYDGFSPFYFERNITPHMETFRSEGTTVKYVKNVFPTKTFPNHHSIATGLYPAEHGVLGADIYDLDLGKLPYGAELYEYEESIQPIWVTNQLAGHKSGCIMWPGSEFHYTNQRLNCTFLVNFNLTMTWEARIDKAIKFFENGANLVLLYVEEPDHEGHMIGTENEKENTIIHRLDEFTRTVIDKTQKLDLNLIFLSDHGMINTTPSKFINLTSWLPAHKEKVYGSSPVLQIDPVNEDRIYQILVNASVATAAFKVYRNRDLPERWNYRNSRRTGPLTVVAEPGYAFDDMWNLTEYYSKKFNIPCTNNSKYGIHGYDNNLPSMHSFFMAKGPSIKQHHTVDPFDTVDLFHLFCEILQIPPREVSGNRDNILDILASHVPPQQEISIAIIILIVVSVSLVLFSTISAVYMVRRRGRETQHVPSYVYEEEPEGSPEEQKLLEINTLPELKV